MDKQLGNPFEYGLNNLKNINEESVKQEAMAAIMSASTMHSNSGEEEATEE